LKFNKQILIPTNLAQKPSKPKKRPACIL